MRRVFVAAAATLALVLAGTPAQAVAAAPGAPGIGDPYFPDYGNGGYDVSHYDVRQRYYPDTDRLTGTTTILAKATQGLDRFNLDFLLTVSSVKVNGWTATYERRGDHELVVTPARPILGGQDLTIVVTYQGTPSQVDVNGYTAWTRTPDGALAVGEPEMAWWWFPSNDHPLDKATFDISTLVPNGTEVLSNGVMPRPPMQELTGWTRWSWRSSKPMATYLAFLAIGQYEIRTDTAPNGLQVINAYSELLGEFAEPARASVERTAEILEWASGIYGPYPFEAQGGVVVPPATLGFALENQTRPVYAAEFFRRGSHPYVVVHELAHQWFGDSVSVNHWKDIWLNEGFASYSAFLWSEYTGEGTAQEVFDFYYNVRYPADHPMWDIVVADPGAANIFSGAVYDRGAMTLHQIRLTIGDDAFFKLLKKWTATRQYGNGTTAQFQELAEQVSGEDLDGLFNAWLYSTGRPPVVVDGGQDGRASQARATVPVEPVSYKKIQEAQAHEAARGK